MKTGALTYSQVDLSIGGEGDAGLSLKRSLQLNSERMDLPMGEYFTHNWDIQLREERQPWYGACYPSEYHYIETVTYEGFGESFYAWGGGSNIVFEQIAPTAFAKIDYISASTPKTFTFTATDGAIVEFLPMAPKASSMCKGDDLGRCAYASRITRPDGTTYDLAYETLSDGKSKRLKSVVSSRGFALLFQHASNSRNVTKACALNLANTAMPSNGVCPAGVPTATYTYSGDVQTNATDAGGAVSQFAINTTAKTYSLHRPGDVSPYVTGQYMLVGGNDDREKSKVTTSQALIDGRTFDYDWDIITNQTWVPMNADGGGYTMVTQVIAGGAWDDGNGDEVELVYGRYKDVSFNSPFPGNALHATIGPEQITDQIGRTTTLTYCVGSWGDVCPSGAPLYSMTLPEGNSKVFGYDGYWRLASITLNPKAGGDPIVTSTAYPSYQVCNTSVLLCNKPSSTTDARGKVTNYTYDPVHGGVLTMTAPADANGIRPQTRYFYAQRYAWIKSGSGYAQAATPVWVLTSEEYCRTTAASGNSCAGGASDEVVTTYEYQTGNASTPSNLWLTGKAVSADGVTLRTCFGYDGYGRRIWETEPNANLSSCS